MIWFIAWHKNFSHYASIMLSALGTYYAQNYAGIIGGSLVTNECVMCNIKWNVIAVPVTSNEILWMVSDVIQHKK